MKEFKSLSDAREWFDSIRDQFAVQQSVPEIGELELYTGSLSEIGLGQRFNAILRNNSAPSFSITLLAMGNEVGESNAFKNIFSDSIHVSPPELNLGPFSDDAWNLCAAVFSDSFCEEQQLTRQSIVDRLQHLIDTRHEEWYDAFEGDLPVFRLEEIRDDLRILLLVDPINESIKLSYTHKADKGIISPVSIFFQKKLDPFRLAEMEERDTVMFFEEQGHDKYPLAYNNQQQLQVTFCDRQADKGTMQTTLRSRELQVSFLKEMVDICEALLGPEVLQEGKVSLDSISAQRKELSYYSGTAVYCMPDFTVSLSAGEFVFDDPNKTPLFAIAIVYRPFTGEPEAEGDWFPHPYVFDAMK